MCEKKLSIGVLALQGAVCEHIKHIKNCKQNAVIIKNYTQLDNIDALILPGGESTTIGKLLKQYNFIDAIRSFAIKKPILGTCAGMVLLAEKISDSDNSYLNLLDITVKRNASGRQKDSFETNLKIKGLTKTFPAIFIRAPYIVDFNSKQVEVLAKADNYPVFVKQKHLFACSFHPELSNDNRIIKLFISQINN